MNWNHNDYACVFGGAAEGLDLSGYVESSTNASLAIGYPAAYASATDTNQSIGAVTVRARSMPNTVNPTNPLVELNLACPRLEIAARYAVTLVNSKTVAADDSRITIRNSRTAQKAVRFSNGDSIPGDNSDVLNLNINPKITGYLRDQEVFHQEGDITTASKLMATTLGGAFYGDGYGLTNLQVKISGTNSAAPSDTTTIRAWVNVTPPNGAVFKMPLYQ